MTKPKTSGPKPRTQPKRARTTCARGHVYYGKPAEVCWICKSQDDRKEREELDQIERKTYYRDNPVPDVMTIRTGDGRVIEHRLPRLRRRRS
jgi:hypothetical protein